MDWPLCIVSPPFGLSPFHFHASHPRNPPAFISNGGLNRDDGVLRDVGGVLSVQPEGVLDGVCVWGGTAFPKVCFPRWCRGTLGRGFLRRPWGGQGEAGLEASEGRRCPFSASQSPQPELSVRPWVEARRLHTYPLWPPAPATWTRVRCLRRARACPAVPLPRLSPKVSAAFGVMVVTGSDVGTLKVHLSGSSQQWEC